jgi:hypothetical protein
LARLLAVGQAGVRVRPLGGTRAGEVRIGRFLRNHRVTSGEMIATARAHTAGLVSGRDVLVIQDTTSLRDDGHGHSLNLHPSIVVDASEGALLGLLHADLLSRDGTPKPHCNNRRLAEKESRRWVDTLDKSAALLSAGASRVTMVADREGDFYEDFVCRPPGVNVLIRAHHDRVLANGTRLFSCTRSRPELGRETIALPAAPGRAARSATLALRVCQVEIKRPQRNLPQEAAKLPPTASLSFVEAYEMDPPAGVPAIHWRLLTTHEVTTLAQALQMTRHYRQRWVIEQLFRVMKTKGFDVEAVRIEDTAPFEKLATAILIAAIQVLQMVRERDGHAGRPLNDLFDTADQPALQAICHTLQGNTARQRNPHPQGSLAYAAWVCARLGGWTGYYGKPGPVVILNGLMQLNTMLRAWNIARVV